MNLYAFRIEDAFHPAWDPSKGIGGTGYASLGQLMTELLKMLFSLSVALSIIFIIVSGYKFITASGDEKQLASAKATLTYAIVGLVSLLLVFLVLQIVQYIIGSSVGLT